jgi:hypothetical protein
VDVIFLRWPLALNAAWDAAGMGSVLLLVDLFWDAQVPLSALLGVGAFFVLGSAWTTRSWRRKILSESPPLERPGQLAAVDAVHRGTPPAQPDIAYAAWRYARLIDRSRLLTLMGSGQLVVLIAAGIVVAVLRGPLALVAVALSSIDLASLVTLRRQELRAARSYLARFDMSQLPPEPAIAVRRWWR